MELSRLYYNPKTGLRNADDLYRKAEKEGIPISHNKAKKFINDQSVDQIYRNARVSE
jgi:hypothetical protein